MSGHVVPVRVYYLIFGALLALTAFTVAVAYLDLGSLNLGVALTIAMIKALLVVLYFMHLRYSSKLTKLFAVAALVWFGILLLLTFSDYVTRTPVEFPV